MQYWKLNHVPFLEDFIAVTDLVLFEGNVHIRPSKTKTQTQCDAGAELDPDARPTAEFKHKEESLITYRERCNGTA